ncbi:GTPase-associated system all-helical protein GASH [Desulfotignum phosphitoxidans]|jgi:hypothetical protein|uniref:GTPase-associated system helical domain-containing protein n=1 Tax=Desulfotignum phosphitoxidans DSM 13687 TaxID=1286635 RepID=S0G8B4_9BACT|nr:GTPase-associated system all-helical protein GASH [Desulfotignum phosphitoxidans]EMS81741.1 hypothetical protein Dpo_1c08830 [Desulfotignum phosphitoxidans DSM 13687]
MSDLLKRLNKAGLIEKLDGNDERFAKIELAANKVAEKLKESPLNMIRAVLAGLDPDIPSDDPAITIAADALFEVWTSVRSVHTDPPIFLYRAILLDACNQVAEGLHAVVLSYTATDTLSLVGLGREEVSVRCILTEWARKTEFVSLIVPENTKSKRAPSTKKIEPLVFEKAKAFRVNSDALLNKVAAASGPNYRGNAGENPNPHWTNQPQTWSWEFTDRMTELLADQLDSAMAEIAKKQNELISQLGQHETHQLESVKELLSAQRSWLQENVKQSEEQRKADHLRLNTLWWCEALYSSSLTCSYRELPTVLAGVVMPFDLLNEVQTPTPASVTYALSETVAKLPEAEFVKNYNILGLLNTIQDKCSELPEAWSQALSSPPKEGRLSIRDMVVAILQGEKDTQKLLHQANMEPGFSISLPRLAQAIYRQEQAVRLAGVKQ